MKLSLIGAAALALSVVTPVAAEDLVAAPTDQWAGFYAGVHGGYAQGNRNGCGDLGINLLNFNLLQVYPIESCDNAPDNFIYDYDQKGWIAGAQFGYNWTPAETFLVGVEFSASAANVAGELDGTFGGAGTWNALLTATGKLGFTVDRFLVYGEAGVGLATATFEGDLDCGFNISHGGPVAGAGVSFKIMDNASIDLKYQHVWLGGKKSSCTSQIWDDSDFLTIPTELRSQGGLDVIKVGLNFQMAK